MTWKHFHQLLLKELSFLNDEGEKDAIARIIIEHLTEKPFLESYINQIPVDYRFIKKTNSIIKRLKKNEPLQYTLGYAYFDNLKLKVNKNTLIPRPETEELVLNASKSMKSPKKIIDFCTGSGCIAIALAKRFPNAELIATDINEKALKTAKENAKSHSINKQVSFIKHDLLTQEFNFGSDADLIVSNPPYISYSERNAMTKQVLEFEPLEALFVQSNDTLIFYKQIIENIPQVLKINGKAWFEISHIRLKELETYLKKLPFLRFNFHKDMFGKIRFLEATRIEFN
jgi:release factor glutamine methyltransferase